MKLRKGLEIRRQHFHRPYCADDCSICAQPPELAKHVLEDADPEFPQAGAGGILSAATTLVSARAGACLTIIVAGVSAVLAKSFARIFFRNAINVGLPVLICDTDQIDQHDELEVDLAAGTIKNLTRGVELVFAPLPEVMLTILEDGGLAAHVQKHGDLRLE